MVKLTKLCLALVLSCIAGMVSAQKYAIDEEFTSVAALDGKLFMIVNKADGMAIYNKDAQNLDYAIYDTALGGTAYLWKIHSLASEADPEVQSCYTVEIVKPDGNSINLWGNPAIYLNSGKEGGFNGCFVLGNGDQYGTDVKYGGVWEIEYVDGSGFTLKNKARGGYLASVTSAPTGTDPIYWTFCTLKESFIDYTEDPGVAATPEGKISIITNGTLEGDDVSCFFTKEPGGYTQAATIFEGVGCAGSKGLKIVSHDNPSAEWDTQFWLRFDRAVDNGSTIHIEFDYRASNAANVSSQQHNKDCGYVHWAGLNSFTPSINWKHFSQDFTISADGVQSIAFNLNVSAVATEYYFDNFVAYMDDINWTDIIVNGNMEGESAECFYITEQGVGGPFLAPIIEGVGVDGSKAVKVESYNDPSADWDTQFFIRLPYQLPAGTKYKVSFDYKATKEGQFQTQSHVEPGNYIHWVGIGEGTFSTAWKTFKGSGTISADQSTAEKPMQTIAFNLGLNKMATKFFFDNIKFEVPEDIVSSLTENPAVDPKPYPAEITSMAIVGFDGSWDATAGWEMTQDADDDAVWTLTKIFTANAGNYEYKATANGNWGRYVLPSGDNASYTFPAAGDYKLTFTVNTKTNSLTLVVGRILDAAVIVGDFLGLEDEAADFNPANGWAMTKDADDPVVWTLTKDFTAEAKKYRYKAVGNGSYDAYQLPGEGNNEFEFGTAEYPVGNYELTFTLNTEGTLELAAVKKADTYTVAGSPALFGSDWDVTDANNELTQNADGTYSITYTDVALTGDVEYKVVMDNDYAYGQWPAQNRVIGISMAGTYDITINFNPADGSVWETMAIAKEITAAGYATYCSPYAINFEGTGVKAYFAKKEGTTVTFYEIFNAPANTGLLLKATEGTYKLKMEAITGEAAANVTDNVLIGVNEQTVVNKKGIFVLMNVNNSVGFYQTTAESFTVGANTAYIDAIEGARSFIGFDFDGGTTAIDGVATVKESNGEIYNLQGQRIVKAQKGLYIINGNKVLVK